MKYFARFNLLLLFLVTVFLAQSVAQSANSLTKNAKNKVPGKDRYFSKSYGEVQFNKYRGQLPPKGAMIQCAFSCLSLATCHCIGLNVHTSECHFYSPEDAPPYDAWKAVNGPGSSGLSRLSSNSTNRDYLFFTRDIFAEESYDKVDMTLGRKMLTSWTLEAELKKSLLKLKGKEVKKPEKSKFKKKEVAETPFPYPFVQIEFKESLYITEILLKTTKERSSELKNFQIRVGNESITKYYETITPVEGESPLDWQTATPFDKNKVCFEFDGEPKKGGSFFGGGFKKGSLVHKTIKCQPCGLMGRYLTIQSMMPCVSCKPEKAIGEMEGKSTKKPKATTASPIGPQMQEYPLPIGSIQVFGYPVGGKGRAD